MRTLKAGLYTAAVIAFPVLFSALVYSTESAGQAPVSSISKPAILAKYGKLPLSFEPNHGQAGRGVQFVARGAGYGIYLTSQGAVLALQKPDRDSLGANSQKMTRLGHAPAAIANPDHNYGARSAGSSRAPITDILRMRLVGAGGHAEPQGDSRLPGTASYFIGNDPAAWQTRLPTYGRVRYSGVYPGVDLVYYGNQEQLEYDFVIAPGASAGRIRLRFDGATGLQINPAGNLIVSAADGEIAFHKPVIYQLLDGTRHPVKGSFTLQAGNTVAFSLGRYDHAKPLVIDPTLVYSTFLGGATQDYVVAVAVNAAGEVYATGLTWSTDFPLTPGAFEAVNRATQSNSVSTAFISKFDSSGTALIYSTYLGGNAIAGTSHNQGDYSHGIAINAAGEAFLTGWTYSSNFPVTTGAFQSTNKAAAYADPTGFVTRLNATGTGLIYSTYLGGSRTVEPFSIATDAAGNAYTTGATYSTDYPTTTGAFQTVNNSASYGGWNAFVSKLNSTGQALVYSTYLGGTTEGSDSLDNLYTPFGVAVDKSGAAYVTSQAMSADFPVTTATAYQPTNNAAIHYSTNVTFSKLSANGAKLLYSTFLGGSSYSGDFTCGLALDAAGNAYLTGYTYSSDFPVTTGAYQTINKAAGNYDNIGFVAKINPALSGKASLAYSTFLGGSYGTDVYIPAVDSAGNVYLTGTTSSSDFPVTANAFQSTNGYENAFLTELNATGTKLLYSSFLGGYSQDTGAQVVLDSAGGVYIGGSTASSNFPITKGAFQDTYHSEYNTAFVAKFSTGTASTTQATATTLTASVNPQKLGGAVTFTAAVALASGTAIPTGSVVFSVDEVTGATVTLNSAGKAVYATSALSAGQHYVLASYTGNTTYAASGDGLIETVILPPPAILPAAGTYSSAQLITLSTTVSKGAIYYTLNGAAPTPSSTKYSAPFLLASGKTVKAIVADAKLNTSPAVQAVYVIDGAPWALAAPASSITTTTATLNGFVNADGLAGTWQFHYGASATALTKATTATTMAASTSSIPVSAALTGLTTQTTYYFRVVATTPGGTVSGAVVSFKTN